MVVRGRACVVVPGRARSCVRGRARSVVCGRARSVVCGRAWSCAVVRGRESLPWHERTHGLMDARTTYNTP